MDFMNKEISSLLSLEEVVSSTGGVHVLGEGELFFNAVQTDSRKVEKNTFFIPLIGENQDGHKYIPQAIEKGCTGVLISFSNFEADGSFFADLSKNNPNVLFIAVDNTLSGLQRMAACYVEKFGDLIKIGVTGSSGKTTTKEIAASILSQKYNVITNEGNLNSETGLPLSVFKIRKEHQVGLFEMGMNRKDEIKEISAVLKPRFAIITNIGSAHIGNLGSRENIALEKSRIFDHFNSFGTAIIPKDDDFVELLSEQVDGKVILYGDGVDERITLIEDKGLEGIEFSIEGKKVILPFPGIYNYKNALAAIELGLLLGVTQDQIVEGIKSIKPMFGRSQVLHGKYTIVQDCYNANPDSMEKAIDFVSSVQVFGKKVFVLGDMLELGESSKKDHEKTGRLAFNSTADLVVFIGTEMKYAYDAVSGLDKEHKCFYYEGKSEETINKVVELLHSSLDSNDVLLIKGSRGMELERITKLMEGEGN